MLRRAIPTLFLVGVLVTVAATAFGPPDPGRAAGFFAGGEPSIGQGEAVVSALCWGIVLVVAVVLLVGLAVNFAGAVHVMQPTRRAALLVAVGVLVLTMGIVHRVMPADTMCCGADSHQVGEAVDLAR